ncbi:MAG: peptidoglycan DD-metalloendopeptidase family protein [Bacillus sp. (in: firmicutes)]
MADDRRREIVNRIKKRRQANRQSTRGEEDLYMPSGGVTAYVGEADNGHPLFRKNVILLKVLVAALLFMATAVLFKLPSPKLDGVRATVTAAMEKEMQFAYVSDWYEETFGKPLVFLPADQPKDGSGSGGFHENYAIPAGATVLETYKENGNGIIIEMGDNRQPVAIQKGIVVFAGKKDETGNTVIIQHSDKSESWYGQLESIDVSMYAAVEKGDQLGTVEGKLFFGLKKEEAFIDPGKVLPLE